MIFNIIKKNISMFDSFESVYLFGSILNQNKFSNDLDLLLIYSEYSSEIDNDINKISTILQKECGLYTDLTVLSFDEEKETKFLKRISPYYLKIK